MLPEASWELCETGQLVATALTTISARIRQHELYFMNKYYSKISNTFNYQNSNKVGDPEPLIMLASFPYSNGTHLSTILLSYFCYFPHLWWIKLRGHYRDEYTKNTCILPNFDKHVWLNKLFASVKITGISLGIHYTVSEIMGIGSKCAYENLFVVP